MSWPTPISQTAQQMMDRMKTEDHPEPELLLAYHEQQLDEELHDALQEHLAVCRQCSDFIVELVHSEDITTMPPDEETEQALARMQERLGLVPEPAKETRRIPLALAAALAVICLGLGLLALAQKHRIDSQSDRIALLESVLAEQPKIGHSFEIVYLEAEQSPVRSSPRPTVIADSPTLVLNHLVSQPGGKFRAELVDTNGNVLWLWEGIEPTSLGNFTMQISPSLQSHGEPRIDLYRLEEGEPPILDASFEFELVSPPG